MTAPAFRDWFGIRAEDSPVRRHDFADLLRMAESMLSTRRQRFPAMIAAGELEPEAAQAEIAAFEDLVADWRFIVSAGAEGAPASSLSLWRRRQLLDASLQTIADLAREQRGFSETLGRQAEAVIALRWHLEPGREQIALARLTHQLRADAAQRREPATCN
ncbi:hypothetical protein [Qipengyuania citrea]|uniref:hypothetical protein n=1 Tax=Qipengyuania citrea TaxID=225971 RepID=UPI00209F5328|nr:hypothetical protein [Qipengyuania citrea]MCP2016865.1 hypothetical protein [Qipengyuania citrea]